MDGKGEVEDSENVVRLPRDWVGPPEELIPIGARARARARESLGESHAGTESAAERGESVPGAAFWGEDSAAVHHAIPGPTSAPDPTGVLTPVSEPVGGAPRLGRRAWHRPALTRRAVMGVASAVLVAGVIAVVLVLRSGAVPRGGTPPAATSASLVHFERLRSAVRTGVAGVGVQIRQGTRIADARLARQRQAVYRDTREATELDISQIRRRRSAAAARASAARAASSARPPVSTAESTPVSETPVTPSAEASTAPTTTAPAATTAPATTSSPSTSTGSDSGTHRAFGPGGLLGSGHATGG